MLTAGSIYPDELTLAYNKDVELTRQRAVEFFGKLWKELPAPPAKKILNYRQYEEMPAQMMKGMINDREHFLLLRCRVITTNPRYLNDYTDWDKALGDGTDTVISIAEKLSGPHINIDVVGPFAPALLNPITGQLSPGKMIMLLEQEVIFSHSFDDNTFMGVRLSRKVPSVNPKTSP